MHTLIVHRWFGLAFASLAFVSTICMCCTTADVDHVAAAHTGVLQTTDLIVDDTSNLENITGVTNINGPTRQTLACQDRVTPTARSISRRLLERAFHFRAMYLLTSLEHRRA